MRKRNLCGVVCFLAILLGGCASGDETSSLENMELIGEDEISPNEDYIEDEADKILYSVQVYQEEDNAVIVNATSNSAFFDDLQYEVTCHEKLSASDVDIVWTTLMGSTESTEENQLAVATISLSLNGEVFSERKINFFHKGIEIVTETIDQNKK